MLPLETTDLWKEFLGRDTRTHHTNDRERREHRGRGGHGGVKRAATRPGASGTRRDVAPAFSLARSSPSIASADAVAVPVDPR
jgi:hypothetical protein